MVVSSKRLFFNANRSECTVFVRIRHKPRISPVLQIMEPMAFPMAISLCPVAAAMLDTSSSGNVVVRLTMVAPMIAVGIFIFRAM